jgi:hypothetical protein
MASQTAEEIATYSTSHEDGAMIACFFDVQEKVIEPR